MTTDATATAGTACPGPVSDGWTRRDRMAGWLLMATWVTLVVSTLVTGHRASTFGHLEGQVAAGAVGEVELVGSSLSADWEGYGGVDVRWREGFLLHTASVTQASSERQAPAAGRDNPGTTVIVGSVEDHIAGLDADVTFTRGEHRSQYFTMAGMEAPGWVGLGYLALLLGTLALTTGPQPWRATRWAWAWLILLVPPYGVAAYLLLGGPTGLLRPREPRRAWLTGGWALLLALILGGSAAA